MLRLGSSEGGEVRLLHASPADIFTILVAVLIADYMLSSQSRRGYLRSHIFQAYLSYDQFHSETHLESWRSPFLINGVKTAEADWLAGLGGDHAHRGQGESDSQRARNRNRDIIDEARRATLIGKGAEGMELGRALEVEAKISEIPAPDELVCDGEESDFVPTCYIPLLDLNASNPGSVLQSYPRAPIDPQFGFKAHMDVDNCFWLKPAGGFVNPPAGPPAFTADHFRPFALDGTYVPHSSLALPETDLLYWCLNSPNSGFLQQNIPCPRLYL
ncbi:hypothetical protein EDD85DRAFT_957575 [Armillaria nabsnona]|nr:hypothetical protein EDD85DRAFT_957575 [Armillaria nabsnona]